MSILGYGLRPIENILKMGLHYELAVYKACYDLLIEIFQFTKDFSKEYKYAVGKSIRKETIVLIKLIFRMSKTTEPNETLTKGLPQGWRT